MPKKKGGKKGAKIVDGVATSEMSREQLVGHCRRIQMELDREREERNFFMLEREKLFALWNIAMEQLHAQKIKTQLAVAQMTEHDEEKELEVLTRKQKLRYLLTEQSNKIDQARLDNLRKLQKAQNDMHSMQLTLKEDVTQKSKELRQTQSAMHELMRQMKLKNAKNVTQVRDEMCQDVARLESEFLRAALERERKEEIATENEQELIKNRHLDHVEQLKGIHHAELQKIQAYFHSITINNLATISALQDEIREMKEYEKKIFHELQKSNNELKKLEDRIDSEERNKHAFRDSELGNKIRKELKKGKEAQETREKYARGLEVANEALLQKLWLVQSECKIFKQTVTKAVLDMQQEASLKRMILELKLKAAAAQNQRKLPALVQPENHDDTNYVKSPQIEV